MLKSQQKITCPVCKKKNLHSRVGNKCSSCGYVLEEKDFQYGAFRYTIGLLFLIGITSLFKGLPFVHLVLFVIIAFCTHPLLITKYGAVKLKVQKLGMAVVYIVWATYIAMFVLCFDFRYMLKFW